MATEPAGSSFVEVERLVRWLDDQRSRDREQVGELERTIEQLQQQVREQALLIARLDRVASPSESTTTRDAHQDEVVNQLREHVVLLERVVEDHLTSTGQAGQARSAEEDRGRRAQGQLAQDVTTLRQALDQGMGRLQALAEESRRDRQDQAMVPKVLDDLGRVQASILTKLAQMDEVVNRLVKGVAILEHQDERRQEEVTRLDNWQKLSGPRWTRDFEDLRRGIDDRVAATDERVQEVRGVLKQIATLSDLQDTLGQQLEEVRVRIDFAHQSIEQVHAGLGRLDARLPELVRDSETMQRRIGDQGSQIVIVGQRGEESHAELGELAGVVETLRRDHVQLQAGADRSDGENRRLNGRIDGLQQEIREQGRALSSMVETSEQLFQQALSRLISQMADQLKRQQDHRRRLLNELNQQFEELQDLSGTDQIPRRSV